jgi:hypothetical protein
MELTKKYSHHRSAMTFAERLRTQRVQIAVPVVVRGQVSDRPFEEATHSVSVNAYGGVVRLSAPVTMAQQISVANPRTATELPGMVTFVGPKNAGKSDISFEFSDASVSFWGIGFPGWDLTDRKGGTPKSRGKI